MKCACISEGCENDAEEYIIDGDNISPGMNDYCNEPCTNERHDLPPFHNSLGPN